MNGNVIERKDRNRHGGGVAVFISDELNYSRRADIENPAIESIWIELKLHSTNSILIGTYYRPPNSNIEYQNLIETTISQAISTGKEVYVLGDLNYNMLCVRKAQFVRQLCIQHNLQVIESTTRITENSSSLLDIVLTNNPQNVKESRVISHGLSDHSFICIVRKLFRPKIPPKMVTFKSCKKFDIDSFIEDLHQVDWEPFLQSVSVESAWQLWKDVFFNICNKHAPNITMKARGTKTPWVTDEFVQYSHERDRLKVKAEKSGNREIWRKYRDMRNFVNNMRKTLKKVYYQNQIMENKRNPKELWTILKTLTPSSKTSNTLRSINVDGTCVHTDQDVAEKFNAFFISAGLCFWD